MTLKNELPESLDYGKITVKHLKQRKCSWRVTTGTIIVTEFFVEAKIPQLVDNEMFQWGLSDLLYFTSNNWTDDSNTAVTVDVKAPARQITQLRVTYCESIVENLQFLADLIYTLDNGPEFSTEVSGVYGGVCNTPLFKHDDKTVAIWDEASHHFDYTQNDPDDI